MSTHLAQNQGAAPQKMASSPDQVLAPAVQAQILPANLNRVSAYVQNTGANPARVGDPTTGATSGFILGVNAAPVELATTDAIFGFSTAGTTLNATEIIRA